MLLVALLLVSHAGSQGKSRFDIDDSGEVRVTVELSALDLPELCNVELSVSPARRAEQEDRLDACIERGFPFWLRLSADATACPLKADGWRELEPPTVPAVVALSATARCPAGAQRVVIDWGFFSGTPLDHTNVARIRVPHDADRAFLFSKRAARLEVELGSAMPWRALVIAVALACGAGLFFALRAIARRRR
jgi:hypothetical protein